VKKDLRRRARESALQILYQWEVGQSEIDHAIRTFFDQQWPEVEPPSEVLRSFASDLASETVRRLPAIDELIAETTERWRPERMAILDRLILRLATSEMLRDPSTPPAVVINEAIELARTFSTEDSAKFINGMLDGIRRKITEKSTATEVDLDRRS
jgi:transcription antitermination protein NusB